MVPENYHTKTLNLYTWSYSSFWTYSDVIAKLSEFQMQVQSAPLMEIS